MRNKKPFWFRWQHKIFENTSLIWKNRYKTEKARSQALNNLDKKGHKLIEIGEDNY